MAGLYNPGAGLSATSGMEIVVSNFEFIQSAIIDVKYPEFLWNQVLPSGALDININPGANISSYRVRDQRGVGAFRAKNNFATNTVQVAFDKRSTFIQSAAVSAEFDNQDIREYQMGYAGDSLFTEYGEAMRHASDRHIEACFFFGSEDVDFAGWINAPEVPITTASTKGAGGTTWAVATPEEIVADVNAALTSVWGGSKQVFNADTIFLPPKQYAQIAGMSANQLSPNGVGFMTVLTYIKQNNIYTSTTGRELNVVPIRYLEGAGVAPQDSDRMRVGVQSEEVYYMPMPLPLTLTSPTQTPAGFGIAIGAEYRFGNVSLRYPQAHANMDGI